MHPVHSREAYLKLRNGGEQASLVKRIRAGEEQLKSELVQMNYSCLPNEDGSLKGSKQMTTTVGMDIDHIPADEMQSVRERILAKKDELGLLMLEESARGQGYHLVFRRKPELSQEENLKWASGLLGVEYDKGAKDITRVFFTTTEQELVFLDDIWLARSEYHRITMKLPEGVILNEYVPAGEVWKNVPEPWQVMMEEIGEDSGAEWYRQDTDEPFDGSAPITEDMTLYVKER